MLCLLATHHTTIKTIIIFPLQEAMLWFLSPKMSGAVKIMLLRYVSMLQLDINSQVTKLIIGYFL